MYKDHFFTFCPSLIHPNIFLTCFHTSQVLSECKESNKENESLYQVLPYLSAYARMDRTQPVPQGLHSHKHISTVTQIDTVEV